MDYITYVTQAHKLMDDAHEGRDRVLARRAMSAAQSARARASSAAERGECADLIREAERLLV